MLRRIAPLEAFDTSLAALADSMETEKVVEALVYRAATRPFDSPTLPDTNVRVIKTVSYGRYPAVRLFYAVAHDELQLLYVEPYDELV